MNFADRELDVDVLQVVHRGAAHGERAEVLAAPLRDRDLALAREELAGDRLRVALDLLRGALGDDVAAVHAGARPHVDQVVGRAHHLLVVLDHEHGVAEVAQPLERRRSACRCRAGGGRSTARRGCRARRRAGSRSASRAAAAAPRRRRASRPRGRAAGSRRRRSRGRSAARGSPSGSARRSAARSRSGRAPSTNSIARCTDMRVNSWMFLPPTVTASTSGFRRAPLQTGHGPEAHVLLDPLALLARVGLAVAALEARDDPLEGEHVRAARGPSGCGTGRRPCRRRCRRGRGSAAPRSGPATAARGRSRSGRRSPG